MYYFQNQTEPLVVSEGTQDLCETALGLPGNSRAVGGRCVAGDRNVYLEALAGTEAALLVEGVVGGYAEEPG